MHRFFASLKSSLELYSARLRRGRAFLPAHLKKRRFTDGLFPPVARHLANQLGLTLEKQLVNEFPDELEIGWKRQIVDYVLGDPDHPLYYFELESLDRAQLYLFLPHGGSRDESKLWYYWGTLCKKNLGDKSMPRYFVFLLILPDQPVGTMPLWDISYNRLFSREIRPIIQDNPFSFYDRMIKTSARLFLRKRDWLVAKNRAWEKGRLQDYQDTCELVILTCTGRQLIMSRGRDAFDPAKEKAAMIRWK